MAANGHASQPPVGSENINTDIITLTRFLNEEQAKHKEATGDFTYVLGLVELQHMDATHIQPTGCCAMRCSSRSRA